MRLPRWTVYPALLLLIVFLIPGVPHKKAPVRGVTAEPSSALNSPPKTSPSKAPAPYLGPTKFPRMVVLGIDGMDPRVLRDVIARYPERMANFAKLVTEGGLHELGTSTPPQSPVAWSNFTTGLDPGGHGIFDFIHRDPMTRAPAPSTTKIANASVLGPVLGYQFPLGGDSESNRTGKAFWKILAEHGVPAFIWRMPANFPVEPAKGLSFSGMMTPAIDSAYGKYTFYTSDPPAESFGREGKIVPVREYNGRIDTSLSGPPNVFKANAGNITVPLTVHVDHEAGAVTIELADRKLVMKPGQWSDFVRVSFALLPAGASSVAGVVRFYLRGIAPAFELYASPVNIDPIDPIAPVSSPKKASRDLANVIGIYYTQGMPEDVNALKERVITDAEFMQQSDLVHDEGVRMMDYALDRWLAEKDGGFLFFYFSGIDLCGHMMWRHSDDGHPFHDDAFAKLDSSSWSHRPGSTWHDVIADLYMRMDPVLGDLRSKLPEGTRLVVMSDHGFKSYRRKFSLNTWLVDNGYLVLKPGRTKELPEGDAAFDRVFIMDAVDWSKTRAYGVGFNGLYLNLKGRELDDPKTPADESGIVNKGAGADALIRELKDKLEALRDGGERVVLRCDPASEVYHGARAAEAPDIIVGYNANYGNSDESSSGRIPHDVLSDNHGGTFNGSHLMSPDVVPGILLTNGAVLGGPHRLEDLTVEILKQYGIAPEPGMRGTPVLR
jgi:predicted AlkP superfamily phosphohydrolase/phosphomutase